MDNITVHSTAFARIHSPWTSGGEDECDEFRRLAVALSEYGHMAGVQIVPFRDPGLPLFRALSDEARASVIRALATRVGILDQVAAQAGSFRDSPALIWQAFKEFRLRPPSDYFSHFTDDSVIEIHDQQGVQIFCNFNFYRYCSYSLEELHSNTWDKLFTRDQTFVDRIIEIVVKVYSGQVKSLLETGLPKQRVTELFSVYRNTIELDMRYIAPLFQEGTNTPVATSPIESVRLLTTTTERRPEFEGLRLI